MKQITIDADALFRAVSATGYKLLAYHLNLDNGGIESRTLRPDEVADAPQGPSVAELPKLGGDLAPKKNAQPFGPPPVDARKKLFGDDEGPKKKFDGDFWKKDSKKADPFGAGGFRRENATKKLAEMFGGSGDDGAKKDLFRDDPRTANVPVASAPTATPKANEPTLDDPRKPRIPVLTEAQVVELMALFCNDAGDPQIKTEMKAALTEKKPVAAYERVLRKYARTSQQWERYFRKQSLLFAETWLSELGIAWELLENEAGNERI